MEDGLRAAFQFRTDGAVILDLTNVTSLPPEALDAVLGTARVARRQRRRLMVYGVRPDAAQPAEVRRLHAALTVLPDPAGRRLSAVLLRTVLTDRPAIRGAASG